MSGCPIEIVPVIVQHYLLPHHSLFELPSSIPSFCQTGWRMSFHAHCLLPLQRNQQTLEVWVVLSHPSFGLNYNPRQNWYSVQRYAEFQHHSDDEWLGQKVSHCIDQQETYLIAHLARSLRVHPRSVQTSHYSNLTTWPNTQILSISIDFHWPQLKVHTSDSLDLSSSLFARPPTYESIHNLMLSTQNCTKYHTSKSADVNSSDPDKLNRRISSSLWSSLLLLGFSSSSSLSLIVV